MRILLKVILLDAKTGFLMPPIIKGDDGWTHRNPIVIELKSDPYFPVDTNGSYYAFQLEYGDDHCYIMIGRIHGIEYNTETDTKSYNASISYNGTTDRIWIDKYDPSPPPVDSDDKIT